MRRPAAAVCLGAVSFPRLRPVSCLTAPAIPAAVCLAAGIQLAHTVGDGSPGWHWTLITVLLVLCVVLRVEPVRLRWLALLLPLGFAWGMIHLRQPWQTYTAWIRRPSFRAGIRGTVVSSAYAGGALRSSARPVLKLQAIRLPGQPAWQECNGKIIVEFPPATEPLGYGTVLESDGVFREPDSPPFPGAFDYRHYLRGRAILSIFQADSPPRIRTGGAIGWRRFPARAFRLRDRCAEGLVRGLPPGENQSILLAMGFGLRDYLEPGTRRRFLRSGAIHIFAISGLHVGIVAVLAAGLLRLLGVSFRWRFFLLPVLLGGYVFVTGWAPSAVRAWIMLSIWALSRAFLLPGVPLNSVAVAAVALLFVNPLNLFATGFQFTFVIVTVLVAGWPLVSSWTAFLHERWLWMPHRTATGPSLRCRSASRWACRAAGGGLLAWLGSVPLVAFTNGLFIPFAVLTNVGLCLAASGILALAVPKMLAGCLGSSWLNQAVALPVRCLLEATAILADLGSRAPASLAVVPPPALAVVCVYVLLGAALLPGGRDWRRRATAGAAALAVGAGFILRGMTHGDTPRTTIVHGAGVPKPVVILEPGPRSLPVVLNTGGYGGAGTVASWLKIHGYREVEALLLSGTDWASAASARTLITAFGVRTLVVPEPSKRSRHVPEAILAQLGRGGKVRYLGLSPGATPRDQTVRFGVIALDVKRLPSGMKQLQLRTTGPGPDVSVTVNLLAGGGFSIREVSGGRERTRIFRPVNQRQVVELAGCSPETALGTPAKTARNPRPAKEGAPGVATGGRTGRPLPARLERAWPRLRFGGTMPY